MKHCDRCHANYSDEFKFCPEDGTTLRSAAEWEDPHRVSVPAACAGRSKFRIRKWSYAVFAIVLAAGAMWVFTATRVVPSQNQDAFQSAADLEPETNPKPVVKQRVASPRRVARDRAAEPDDSRNPAGDLVQQARAQQLVAAGYRNLQQRDYEGARDAFEQALEIDPHSIAAQKGLKAAQTAESVGAVAGLLRR
jgi:tetratricopeptide (TPR) repeat protein